MKTIGNYEVHNTAIDFPDVEAFRRITRLMEGDLIHAEQGGIKIQSFEKDGKTIYTVSDRG